LHQEDKEKLIGMFSEIEDDPMWFQDSPLFLLYSQRIPILEFFSLLSSDSEWSQVANSHQTRKILNLFDKVYGYVRGLSRRDLQNARYKKNSAVQEDKKAPKQGREIMKEIFSLEKFSTESLLDRYEGYLMQSLRKGWDPHMADCYKRYELQVLKKNGMLDFYERMKIDGAIRDNKREGMIEENSKKAEILQRKKTLRE